MASKLVFRGELAPGATPEQVAERLAKVIGQSPATVRKRLFAGGPVKIKTVEDVEQARRYVAAFAKAGAILDVVSDETDADILPAAAPSAAPRRSRRGLRFAVLGAVVLLLVACGAWYTSPVWRNGTVSDAQAIANNALATRDIIAMGHFDVQRAMDIQARLFGAPDPNALFGDEDNLWESFVTAGIDPGNDIDDVVAALYIDGDGAAWAFVIPGRFDADALQRWLAGRYDVERVDAGSGTIYFSWLDADTCEKSPLVAARAGASQVLIANADRFDATWERLETVAAAELDIDEWTAMTERNVLTIGIFRPTSLGQTADGLAGMMLGRAGQAAEPAEAVYFGVAPVLIPPGVSLSGAVSSSDKSFLDTTHDAAASWLAEARASARADQPELLDLYDRISVSLTERTFTADVRLDTDLDNEVQRLFGALLTPSFRAGRAPGNTAQNPPDDEIDDDPVRFFDATQADLERYASFGDGYFEPQWQDGPFAMTVSQLNIDEQGRAQVKLKGEGRGLANLGARSKLVRMRITDVTDAAGETLLPERECGPSRSREWGDAGMISTGTQFVDGELQTFPTVALEKTVALADGVAASEVAAIHGEIEYLLPTRVQSERVEAPLDGKLVANQELRIQFQPGSDRSISYQASGDTRRLLAIRALNRNDQLLESGSAMWGGNWFGSGEHASIDINGRVAAAEVVLAEQFEPVIYSFALPGAWPPMGGDNPRQYPPVARATADALATALDEAPPEVVFEYNQPEATQVAGPALLAVKSVRASPLSGLVAQLELYVADSVPLAGQLNGSSIILDRVELADDYAVALDLGGPVSLNHASGYWLNGEYKTDPDKPWLSGRLMLQEAEYGGGRPVGLNGRIVFRAAGELVTETAPVVPGTRLSAAGTEVVVDEWREDSITLRIPNGAARLVSVEILDADGTVVGRADRIDGTGAESTASVNVYSQPESLRVSVAANSEETEVPFSVDLAP